MMSLYPYVLLLHIVAVLGLFMATGLELTALFRLRSAKSVAQVYEWTNVNRLLEIVFPLAALLILAAGLAMTFMVWGWSHAWISISLAALLVMSVLGATINTRRMKAIRTSAERAPDGPVPAALRKTIFDRGMWTTILTMSVTDLGIVGLMTIKPGWIGSIVVLIVTIAIGFILAQLALRTVPLIEQATTTPALEEANVR